MPPRASARKEAADRIRNVAGVGLQREMSGIEEAHARFGDIAFERFGARGQEKRIVLAEVRLEDRMAGEVRRARLYPPFRRSHPRPYAPRVQHGAVRKSRQAGGPPSSAEGLAEEANRRQSERALSDERFLHVVETTLGAQPSAAACTARRANHRAGLNLPHPLYFPLFPYLDTIKHFA